MKRKKRMTWQLMWRKVRVTELNATLKLLVIYRFQCKLHTECFLGPKQSCVLRGCVTSQSTKKKKKGPNF